MAMGRNSSYMIFKKGIKASVLILQSQTIGHSIYEDAPP